MTTHRITLTMRRRPWWVRLWRKTLHPTWEWPLLESGSWWDPWFAMVVPYGLRAVHRWYATSHHYFWIPCVLCDQPYGGHEGRRRYGKPDSVPDPLCPGLHQGICPACTKAGRGVAW